MRWPSSRYLYGMLYIIYILLLRELIRGFFFMASNDRGPRLMPPSARPGQDGGVAAYKSPGKVNLYFKPTTAEPKVSGRDRRRVYIFSFAHEHSLMAANMLTYLG